jgi:DNA mismatch endonuclease (patch repair protein)
MELALQKTLPQGKFSEVPIKRSIAMAAVRSKGNKTTELRLRCGLVRARVRGWTTHATNVLGRPDFYFSNSRLAVFVDGCFWHGCPACGHTPRTNSEFWAEKLRLNRARDEQTTRRLRRSGVSVIRIWEHELVDTRACVHRVVRQLAGLARRRV